MLSLEQYGDVTRLRFSTPITRALGYEVSAYLTRGVLVDTGFPDVAREFAAWLDRGRPKGIVLTHHHEDHAGNLDLAARGGLPIAAADITLQAVRDEGRLDWYRRVCWGQPPLFRSAVTSFEPPGMRLIHLPGHSHDHHAVWDAERETLFAGDLFIGVKVRIAKDDEVIHEQVKSLRQAITFRPRRMFCAHRGLVPDPVGALKAKADWLEGITGEARRMAGMGVSEGEITRRLLGREGLVRLTSRGRLCKRNLIRAVNC